MEATSCVVDGQQRLNAIVNYIKNVFAVDGRYYKDLRGSEKSDFLKYELAVIELDLDNEDPRVKEIFQRLNRTSNSLTSIEKLASQYAPSQYMLVASHLAGELGGAADEDADDQYRVDPGVDKTFFDWAAMHPVEGFNKLYSNLGIFKSHEMSRKVHLMHVLNLMTTLLAGFFNRNVKSREYLELNSQQFQERDLVVELLDAAAESFLAIDLNPGSYWLNKANLFSILLVIADKRRDGKILDSVRAKECLNRFEENIPEDYKLAATEGVNDVRERRLRNEHLQRVLEECFE